MIEPRRVDESSPFSLGLISRFLLFPFGLLYRFWLFSIRFSFVHKSARNEILAFENPVIITLWHNRLFLAGEWQRRFRKNRKCFGLISGSRDGAWLEAFYSWSGIHAVRGSSNRGGSKAIRGLVKKLKDGHDIGITPDGSQGPQYTAKPGGLLVAKVANSPMLLLSFEYGKHFKLKSWDRFVIPLPFSRVLVRTKLFWVDKQLEKHSTEQVADILNSELMKLTFD
jgi:lysophospholipid acyltransferase (LPLAT)-like uncharacterized protein